MRTVLARVIVLNRNGRDWLDGCLVSLLAQDVPDVEVVLVDNASSDDSVDLVRRRFPSVRVMALAANRGFSGGNNAGAAGSDARYLVFLNNDTRPRPGWLGALVRTAEADPGVGLVTSHLLFMGEPARVDSAGDGYLRAGGAFKRGHGQPPDAFGESAEVFGACGAAFLIRRELFDRLGGFDEDFFAVYEDMDLSYRARLAGARVWYAAHAVVEHAGSATLGRTSPLAVYLGQRNLEWVWIKNSPASLLWRSAPAHVAYDLAAAAYCLRIGRLAAWTRAKLAALGGLPAVWRKRRAVQRTRAIAPAALRAAMTPGWIAVKRREKSRCDR